MRILVLAADNLLRDGLCALLRLESEVDFIDTLDNAEAIAGFPAGQKPDIVILNIASQDSSGTTLMARTRLRWPQARVVVLTLQHDDCVLTENLRAQADACLLKSATSLELASALRSVWQGQRYITPTAQERSTEQTRAGRYESTD